MARNGDSCRAPTFRVQPVLSSVTRTSIPAARRIDIARVDGDRPFEDRTRLGESAVIDEHLGPAVTGRDPRDIEGLLEALDTAAFGNPFAKAAVEMAAWDAWGKAEGKPVYELLGGAARDLALPIRFSLGAGSPEAQLRLRLPALAPEEPPSRSAALASVRLGGYVVAPTEHGLSKHDRGDGPSPWPAN